MNTKNELLEQKSSMLGDTVSKLLEENKFAERKVFRAEEKLGVSDKEKKLMEKKLQE